MKIFIGSSTKRKRIAHNIATELESIGFDVYRWWDKKVFKGSDITIQRLIEMSNICDGAVFIFGHDDKTLIKKGAKNFKLNSPRDNVVLEFGLFVGKNGVKRTLFVTEPKVKIPSDLNGVTYLGSRGYAKRIAERFKEVFQEASDPSNYGSITFHYNKNLLNLIYEGGDTDWSSRSLYVGSKGAKAWEAVEKDTNYNGSREFSSVTRAIKYMITKNELINNDSIISFGPGIGNLDKKIVQHIRGKQYVRYIPVDINYYLAKKTAEAVSNSAKYIDIPFCIIGDFEDGMSLIAETLHKHTPPGRTFMMLGGTFGNLENSEDTFLKGLNDCMEEKDIAILDIFTYTRQYNIVNDPLIPLSRQPLSVKNFIVQGISEYKIDDLPEIVNNIEKHTYENIIPMDEASTIPLTNAFEFKCKKSDKSLIIVRRYNKTKFSKYLISLDFNIIDSRTVGNTIYGVQRTVFIIGKG